MIGRYARRTSASRMRRVCDVHDAQALAVGDVGVMAADGHSLRTAGCIIKADCRRMRRVRDADDAQVAANVGDVSITSRHCHATGIAGRRINADFGQVGRIRNTDRAQTTI